MTLQIPVINYTDSATPPAVDPEAGLAAARESFSGRTLTESQFQEAWAIAGILHAKIHQTGSFRDPLTDYAHVYARDQKFDSLRGETIVRDIYQGRYNQTLNQTRETLIANEKALPETAQERVLGYADSVLELIKAPPTQPFYKAYDRAATTMGTEFGISHRAAKTLMKDAYQKTFFQDLVATGKEAERLYHAPVRDAEIAQRKTEQSLTRTQSRS